VTEPLVEVGLVFSQGLEYRVQAYADGFEMRGWVDGESGQFRHWPLGVGWVRTTGDNEVRDIASHGCAAGVVETPAIERLEAMPAGMSARMRWPAPASARMQRDGAMARYELAFSSEAPVRWFQLVPAAAWVGLSAKGELSRLACTAQVPVKERVGLRLPGDRYAASLQASRLLHVELEPEGWDEDGALSGRRGAHHESGRGNAWLSAGRGGAFELLDVHDVGEGDAVAVDPNAPVADGVDGWQEWPVDVRATVWRAGGKPRVCIRFGDREAERWVRLGADVSVGSTAEQEIVALVLADVEESPERGVDLDDDFDGYPGELPGQARLVEQAGSLRFLVYGLAGELGAPSGFGSGRGDVPSSLGLTFGDPEGARWLTVTSSREADLELARLRAAGKLVPHGEGPADHSAEAVEAFVAEEHERRNRVQAKVLAASWRRVTISMDGTGVEFSTTRHGDRWAALSRVGHTTITVVAQGYEPGEIALVRITDLAPHVDDARRRHRQEVERHLAEHGLTWPARQPPIAPADRARRSAVREVVAGLMDGLDRNPGAPELGDAFTPRIVDAWGGRDRYQQLLWLHTMLRPVTGHGTSGEYPRFNDDDTAEMRVSIHHAAPAGGGSRSFAFAVYRTSATVGGDDEPAPEPEPDPAAIRRGEQHHITFHLVPHAGRWMIDTDLLAILIERLGTIDEVVRPLSQQSI
jgi:hypothetical protein